MSKAELTINEALAGRGRLGSELIEAFSATFALPASEVSIILRATLRASDVQPPAFEVRTGTWELALEEGAVRSITCALLLILILQGIGADKIAVAVIAAVAPLLLDVERVEVSAGDVWVHARLLEAARLRSLNGRALYQALPGDVRAELPFREFLGLLERLERAGLVEPQPDGLLVRPLEATRAFRLKIR